MSRRILALIVVAASLTACGIRGPLYLPGEPPPPGPVSDTPAGEAAEEEVGEEAGEDGDEAER